MKDGFIPLSRALERHWLWTSDEPFDKRSAWVDLIFLANHKDAKILIGTSEVEIKKGQHFTSTQKLADRWNWSRTKVYRYLELLEKTEMITRYETRFGTLLTLVNYGKFAFSRNNSETPNETPNETPSETPQSTENKGLDEYQENTDRNTDRNDKRTQTIMNNKNEYNNGATPPTDFQGWEAE